MAGWSDPAHRLDAERLAELFWDVDWQLGLKRQPGSPPTTIIVCGGAAMCYQVGSRGTGDVDVMYPPMPADLREAVRAVGRRRFLERTWMNDGPAQFASYGRRIAAVTLYQGDHLIVSAPTNEYLLGMKVQAARPEDTDDAVWLMADTGLRATDELHRAATEVSQSTGKEWNPDRRRKRFVRRCVRLRRRQDRAHRRKARRAPSQQDPNQLDPLAASSPKPRCTHFGVISKKQCILAPHSKQKRHRY